MTFLTWKWLREPFARKDTSLGHLLLLWGLWSLSKDPETHSPLQQWGVEAAFGSFCSPWWLTSDPPLWRVHLLALEVQRRLRAFLKCIPPIALCPPTPRVSKATRIPCTLVFPTGRHISVELPVLMKVFRVCAVQHGSHKPHVTVEHLQCG